MLNFVYWPISAILWFWHKLLSYVLDPGWGITWVLSIVLLTFTIRVFLVKPSLNQMRSSRKMSELQPRMAEIRSKYKNDQQKQMEEIRKVQKEMGVNPIAGCLPLLVQMPVFLGLFHPYWHRFRAARFKCRTKPQYRELYLQPIGCSVLPRRTPVRCSAVLLHLHARVHVPGL